MIIKRIVNAFKCLFTKHYVLMEYTNVNTNRVMAYSNRVNVSTRDELSIFASCDGKILDNYKIDVSFNSIN